MKGTEYIDDGSTRLYGEPLEFESIPKFTPSANILVTVECDDLIINFHPNKETEVYTSFNFKDLFNEMLTDDFEDKEDMIEVMGILIDRFKLEIKKLQE